MAKTVLLTGDSIIKHIPDWEYNKNGTPHVVTSECFRGCTTNRLKRKIQRRALHITGYDIIIHIGTNEIANNSHDILCKYQELVDKMKIQTNVAKIVMSLPLPTLTDIHITCLIQIDINNKATWNGMQHGYMTWKSYKPVLAKQRNHEPQQIGDRDL